MRIRFFIQHQAFGVCSRLAIRLGIPPSTVRTYFVYASFVGLGSPLIVYLILAFWLNFKDLVRPRSTGVWD
jgi:phage shock protein C